MDDICVHPEKLYTQAKFEKRQKKLGRIRREAVDKLGSALHRNIVSVFDGV